LKDDCRGRLQTDAHKGKPQLRTQHCHVANEDEVGVRCAGERLRQRASHKTTPTPQIYIEEVLVSGAATRMPAYQSISAAMYRDRHYNMPPLPSSLQTMVVP
jgi:hypothetical protein